MSANPIRAWLDLCDELGVAPDKPLKVVLEKSDLPEDEVRAMELAYAKATAGDRL